MTDSTSEFASLGELLGRHSKLTTSQQATEDLEAITINNKSKPFRAWLEEFGVPARSRDCAFLDYDVTDGQDHARKALRIAQDLANDLCAVSRKEIRPRIFVGLPGTGKTHLACAAIAVALKSGKVSRYIKAAEIARNVRSSYGRKDSPSEEVILERLVRVPFLVIDEIGLGLGSAHEIAMIHDTISERYEEMRPTLLISNLNKQELLDFLGDRIVARFREDNAQIVEFPWVSKRVAIQKEKIEASKQQSPPQNGA